MKRGSPCALATDESSIVSVTRNGAIISLYRASQRAGRPRWSLLQRGKSGLHGTTVPGNARRPPQKRGSGTVPQKGYRLPSDGQGRKGAARAHRGSGDRAGTVNPTGCKTE